MVIRIFILLLAASIAQAVPRPDNRQLLQQLVKMPSVPLTPPFRYYPASGFTPFPDATAARRNADALRKEFKPQPGSGKTYLAIGAFMEGAGVRREAIINWAAAREMLRLDLAAAPESEEVIIALAAALALTDKFTEAAHYLDQTVAKGIDSLDLHLARGRHYQLRCWNHINSDVSQIRTFEDSVRNWARSKPSSQMVREVERDLALAGESFEQARHRNNDHRGNLRLISFEYFSHVVRQAIASLKGEHQSGSPQPLPEKIIVLYRELLGSDWALPEDAAMSGLLTVTRSGQELGLGDAGTFESSHWTALNISAKNELTSSLAALETMAEGEDIESLEALELLGCLQAAVARDFYGAEKMLRRCVALRSNTDRVWDFLNLVLNKTGQDAEAVTLNEQRAKTSKTARHHVMLARAYEQTGQHDLAHLTLLLTLQENKNDFLANLTLANLLLKDDRVADFAGRIQEAINRADQNLGAFPALENLRDLAMTRVIFYGITEDYEQARKILKQWKAPVSRQDFNAALEIIGY